MTSLDNGALDGAAVAEYKARAPYILTALQNEIIGVENRYRKYEDHIRPVPITDLDNNYVQVEDIQANTSSKRGNSKDITLA